MFQLGRIEKLHDYFSACSRRWEQAVFFYRVAGYSGEVAAFLTQYDQAARTNGVVIEGRIPNPDPKQLDYLAEMMGSDFQLDAGFLTQKLTRWLPRLTGVQREAVVTAMTATLQDLQAHGKNENMLRNAYIKYMCWLYYKFERILGRLGGDELPKILYDGTVSSYELQLLVILARAGADIVLLERAGDAGYLRCDPTSQYAQLYQAPGLTSFPADFSLRQLREQGRQQAERQKLYGAPAGIAPCTNAWMKTPDVKEILTAVRARGDDPKLFYNAFVVQYGVEDKLLFPSDMVAFYQQLKREGRKVCLENGRLPPPTPEEIAAVRRRNHQTAEQLAADLAANLQYPNNQQLQTLMRQAFLDVVLEEDKTVGGNLNRLLNKAVYLVAWMKRYQKDLFQNWQAPEVGVFILFGACSGDNEALFLRLLAKLPVDVLVLLPDLNAPCVLKDPALLDLHKEHSLPMTDFPVEPSQMRVRTAAYQAEREMDSILYQNTGLYRAKQHQKAEAVTLQTMYEEIGLLWDQELKYRPGFAAEGDTVTVPVLLEKICGIKDGPILPYWLEIKKLVTPETTLVTKLPWQTGLEANPMKPYATQFLRQGRLQREKIKQHKDYPYGILRPEIQDYLLDKLQVLLDEKLIAGTYQNGTEYTIVSTILGLPKDLLRRIQNFDFTKKNPKLIIISTTEETLSLEDSILVAFLNLVGFDILFFVPTGYQSIEKYFQKPFANEHQLGPYRYDLQVPDFRTLHEGGKSSIRKLFGRSF
ncbi:YceG family protein [Evtepia sp.]|uniref:YceG family protein n=1 Tax=Evtepia sp. TaxID=2773933 RepID=UPI002E79559E|nr:YceG family protein [Evtepia sp.]MEE0257563.1 YceG family protein [Evtepia sp.]